MHEKITPEVLNAWLQRDGRFYKADDCWGSEWLVLIDADGRTEGPRILLGGDVGTPDEYWLVVFVSYAGTYPSADILNPHGEQLIRENITVRGKHVARGGMLYEWTAPRRIDPTRVTFLTEEQLAVLNDQLAATRHATAANPARA